MATMSKKTLIALIASLGVGLLPIGLVALTGCGDNPTEANPYDAGTDAKADTGSDAASDGGGDAAKDGGSDGATDGGSSDAAKDGSSDAPSDGG